MRPTPLPPLRLAPAPDSTGRRPAPAFSEDDFLELARGAPAAQRAFVRALWPRVERTLRSILGSVNDVEDLTQEVFVRVFDRMGRIASYESLRPYVNAIAVNVARESIRSRARRRWLVLRAPEELPELALPGVSAEVAASIQAFYALLAELPREERIAFTLRHVDDKELTEIAAATEASLSTVKRRLARAEAIFVERGARRPELARLFEGGAKWRVVNS